MPKAAKTDDAGKTENLSFEDALKRLETIVESMESKELPLETLLVRFEEGTQLAKICQERLADAEMKIVKLEKNSAGETVETPLTSNLEAVEEQ